MKHTSTVLNRFRKVAEYKHNVWPSNAETTTFDRRLGNDDLALTVVKVVSGQTLDDEDPNHNRAMKSKYSRIISDYLPIPVDVELGDQLPNTDVACANSAHTIDQCTMCNEISQAIADVAAGIAHSPRLGKMTIRYDVGRAVSVQDMSARMVTENNSGFVMLNEELELKRPEGLITSNCYSYSIEQITVNSVDVTVYSTEWNAAMAHNLKVASAWRLIAQTRADEDDYCVLDIEGARVVMCERYTHDPAYGVRLHPKLVLPVKMIEPFKTDVAGIRRIMGGNPILTDNKLITRAGYILEMGIAHTIETSYWNCVVQGTNNGSLPCHDDNCNCMSKSYAINAKDLPGSRPSFQACIFGIMAMPTYAAPLNHMTLQTACARITKIGQKRVKRIRARLSKLTLGVTAGPMIAKATANAEIALSREVREVEFIRLADEGYAPHHIPNKGMMIHDLTQNLNYMTTYRQYIFAAVNLYEPRTVNSYIAEVMQPEHVVAQTNAYWKWLSVTSTRAYTYARAITERLEKLAAYASMRRSKCKAIYAVDSERMWSVAESAVVVQIKLNGRRKSQKVVKSRPCWTKLDVNPIPCVLVTTSETEVEELIERLFPYNNDERADHFARKHASRMIATICTYDTIDREDELLIHSRDVLAKAISVVGTKAKLSNVYMTPSATLLHISRTKERRQDAANYAMIPLYAYRLIMLAGLPSNLGIGLLKQYGEKAPTIMANLASRAPHQVSVKVIIANVKHRVPKQQVKPESSQLRQQTERDDTGEINAKQNRNKYAVTDGKSWERLGVG